MAQRKPVYFDTQGEANTYRDEQLKLKSVTGAKVDHSDNRVIDYSEWPKTKLVTETKWYVIVFFDPNIRD